MVSVFCNNGLNRSVRKYGLTEPGDILDKTRDIEVQEFEKNDKDRMNISLCSLEDEHLKYTGAHNPLWIIRNIEVLETKANKKTIGQFDNRKPYTTHNIELEKDDSFYIFSDEYTHQFRDEKGKKFKTNSFKKLLLSIHNKSIEEQKIIIDSSFEN